MNMYSMPGYFQNMPTIGKELVNPIRKMSRRSKLLKATSMSLLKKLLMPVLLLKRS